VKLVRAAWRLLVGIKDALVLIAMLLFFGLLFAALTARPGGNVGEGALVVDLDGSIVEQPQEVAPFAALSGQQTAREYRARDVIRALDAARTDARVKAVVLDLDNFAGGYPATLSPVADAIAGVRRSKPVFAYASGYTDASYRLAAAATEIWVDPVGGALFAGPGGSQPYFKGLLDRLGVTAHVYRVGRYKAAVEPFLRNDQSPESREANQALYGSLLGQWRDGIRRHRSQAQVDAFLQQPAQVVTAAGGDVAQANLRARIVDRVEGRLAFNRRVAQVAGADATKTTGFRRIAYDQWLAANPLSTDGDAVGVLTVAGDIVGGTGGPGTAAGDTVSKALLDGLAKKRLKALVVRIDSPGGSVLASEQIRQAVLEAKRRKLPVVVSMGGLAASGGYWIATAGDTIFAEPNTITGSIGIFGVIPTFENALAKIGVTADGVRTTPLSGQPDILGGTSPVFDQVAQAGIENGYRQFITHVAQARKLTPQRVDEIGQGRVWVGGEARQLGLVDRFGGLQDAIDEAARRAKLDPKKAHAVYLEKEPSWGAQLAQSFRSDEEADAPGDALTRIAADRRAMFARALGDARRLATGASIQARCLECAGLGPATAPAADVRLLDLLVARLGW
jgi:protease-4